MIIMIIILILVLVIIINSPFQSNEFLAGSTTDSVTVLDFSVIGN